MPDERALELDELHVMSVHFPDDFRVPMRREEGELLSQVDLLHSSSAHGYTRLQARQCPLEIGTYVVGRLDADRHPNQPIADTEARTLLRGQSRVRGSGRPQHERMLKAQAGPEERGLECSSHTANLALAS